LPQPFAGLRAVACRGGGGSGRSPARARPTSSVAWSRCLPAPGSRVPRSRGAAPGVRPRIAR